MSETPFDGSVSSSERHLHNVWLERLKKNKELHNKVERSYSLLLPQLTEATAPKRPYQVFEYRPAWSERWLVLFSIRADDTAEKLGKELVQRFGCAVEVRRKDRLHEGSTRRPSL